MKHIYRQKEVIRVSCVFVFFCFLMGFSVLKIYSIQSDSAYSAAKVQSTRTISLGKTRGYIYDMNMKPLVNSVKENMSVIMADEDSSEMLDIDAVKIKSGLFLLKNTDTEAQEGKYSKNFIKIGRYSENQLCSHIIGYINSASEGVCGIEKAFDKILSDSAGELTLEFSCDANGTVLYGDGLKIIDDSYDCIAGIKLTIDAGIQQIVQEALINSSVEKGAVVVLDTKTAQIRAIASIPAYDVNNIEGSLYDENLPFLNRALSEYPVGSVFKPIVAAAAIENGISLKNNYICNGYMKIGENVFSCYNYTEHGTVDLNKAIEKSCNTFFIDAGLTTGAEKICSMAEKFGFGSSVTLCSTLFSDAGYVPEGATVSSESELANLCFGQGSLLATPLQLAAAYNVFANKGVYIEPAILSELVDENGNTYAYYKSENTRKVLSADTCGVIGTCLYNNMLNGTGVSASSATISSAGKTATAQTGRYNENGKEILCTWFCGYFPYDEPLYTIVVFNEDGTGATADCAPVFKECVEKIYRAIN